jgi:death on curing protein
MLFLSKDEVFDIHRESIEKFGGIHGLRDEKALESAIKSAENRAYYENADITVCAATYAYHLTQAHAFIDGNKRIAAAVSEIFLELNDMKLNASNDQIVDLFLNIAAGKISRDDVENIFLKWTSCCSLHGGN